MTNPTAHGVSVFDGLVDAPSDLSAAIARVRAYIAGESSVILPGDIPAVCAAAERAAAPSCDGCGKPVRPLMCGTCHAQERAAAQEPPAQAEPQPVSVPYELIAHDKPQPRCGWMHAGDQCALAEGKE